MEGKKMRNPKKISERVWRQQVRNLAILGGAIAFLLGLLFPVAVSEQSEKESRWAQAPNSLSLN
jgi:hypothetical protein